MVAIVVPVYNDEEYLSICLDSIKNQTADYWEAWLVDDASTDSSRNIIKNYCDDDDRFHCLFNETNSSAWTSRAKGILAVSDSVKYIMFADGDDNLALNAVEKAYELMEKKPVDILHFGTAVAARQGMNAKKLRDYENYLQPPITEYKGREVFDSFVKRRFEGHLWNKMFNAALLKEVIGEYGAERMLPKAQDKVLYWAVCWQKADLTYRGVSEKLYNYCYGSGVEGNDSELTLEQYHQYLSQAWTEDAISEIMKKHGAVDESCTAILNDSRNNMIFHSVKNFFKLSNINRQEGLELLCKYWTDTIDPARIVCSFARLTWNKRDEFLKLASGSKMFKTTKTSKDIKVIGTYYHRMDNGGIQRVIAQLIPIWHDMGYEVVLFTDSATSYSNEYPLPDYITRVAVRPSFSKCNEKNYYERGISLAELLNKYHVDCMVYHSYFSDVLHYDMCICKVMNVPFIIYVHNVFTRFLRYSDPKFSTIPMCARLADGMVCLSETDKLWWNTFNPNTNVVLNPLTFDISNVTASKRDNHNILFLCRLSEAAKHPHDAITIAQKVVCQYPDAVLYIVGSGDYNYMAELSARIKKLDLEDSIILCGFDKDVEKYYKMCSVFLSCSSHEGFMLTLCEAMSYSIPMVMYDLPYLSTVEGNPGIVSVPQRDMDAAAAEICRLFDDPDRLIKLGDMGRAHLEKMYNVDLLAQWRAVFSGINNNKETDKRLAVMTNTIILDYYDGLTAAVVKTDDKELNVCKRKLRNCSAQLNDIKNSVSFKVGRIITFIPRKIRDLFKKLIKH